MFVLTRVEDEQQKFILIPTKAVYTVGRQSTDLILAEDLSISRTHVRLSLPSAGSTDALTVLDLGSKYGTFINNDIKLNKKMQAKTPIPLQVGDKIRFGALKNVWQVTQLKLVTTPSSLARPELTELQQLLQPLGGLLLPSWTTDCSHLTMDNVTVTVKLLHALLDNKPIVNVAYWRALSKAAHRVHISEAWPNPQDFAPSRAADMPSIKWNPQRTRLFTSKTFVFCNRKHFEMYGPVVQKAGGACKDLNAGVRRQILIKNDVVVIQYVPSTQSQATQTIDNVQAILEQAGRRLIPEYEIGLAILHCSVDKFCNPSYNMVDNSLPTTESMNSSILIPNTERTQTETNTNKGTELVLPESEVYAANVGTEKQSTESQPEPLEKSKATATKQRKRNVMFIDSSDEETNVEQKSESSRAEGLAAAKATLKQPLTEDSLKDAKPAELTNSKETTSLAQTKAKTKRKLTISVDSSDEAEEDSIQLRKITKTLPGDKSKQTRNQSSLVKAAEEKQLAVSPRRSTRSNHVQQPESEKPKEISPRRSLRGKQLPQKDKISVPLIDENSEEEEELFQFQSKAKTVEQKKQEPKKAKLTVPLIDEDSEDDAAPFQFKKQTAATKESAPIPALSMTVASEKEEPLPKITIRNFLGKSQQQSQVQAATESVATAPSQPLKRLRLEQLNESDSDDDENLFKFSDNKKARKSLGRDNDSDNEGNCTSKAAAQMEQNNNECDDDEDSRSTVPFVPESKSKYVVPKPRLQPLKVNISGWLSCNRIKQEVRLKTETDVIKMDNDEPTQAIIKQELDDCDEKEAHLKYIESMRDSIQVRMLNLEITVRTHDETIAADTTDSKYSGRKNFKKFVKNRILHPHRRIMPMKRMQLAEGMVKIL